MSAQVKTNLHSCTGLLGHQIFVLTVGTEAVI